MSRSLKTRPVLKKEPSEAKEGKYKKWHDGKSFNWAEKGDNSKCKHVAFMDDPKCIWNMVSGVSQDMTNEIKLLCNIEELSTPVATGNADVN